MLMGDRDTVFLTRLYFTGDPSPNFVKSIKTIALQSSLDFFFSLKNMSSV